MKPLASLALTLSIFVLPPLASAEEINGVDFPVVFRGDVLPKDASPPWHQASAVSNWGEVENGIWCLDTDVPGGNRNVASRVELTHESGHWNGRLGDDHPGTTVECSLRVIAQSPHAERATTTIYLNLQKKDGTNIAYVVNFAPDVVFLGTQSSSPRLSHRMDTTEEFSVYRLVVNADGFADLYLDNDENPIISGYDGSGPSENYAIVFGSNSSTFLGGESEWKYVAFTNDGAFPPTGK